MSTATDADSREGLEAYAAADDRHSPIAITVTSDTRPGRYRAYVGPSRNLCAFHASRS
jgi:hypothetical protein